VEEQVTSDTQTILTNYVKLGIPSEVHRRSAGLGAIYRARWIHPSSSNILFSVFFKL
jgi:hypothetical protein